MRVVLVAWASPAAAAVGFPVEMWEQDGFLRLAIGRYVWQHGWVPTIDPFSFIAAGQAFIAHEWLDGLILYGIHEALGIPGLIVLKTLLAGSVYTLIVVTARTIGAQGIVKLTGTP
jgi:hypothetical protein